MLISVFFLMVKGLFRDVKSYIINAISSFIVLLLSALFGSYAAVETFKTLTIQYEILLKGCILFFIIYTVKNICFGKYPLIFISLPGLWSFIFSQTGIEKVFVFKLIINILVYLIGGSIFAWGVSHLWGIDFTISLIVLFWSWLLLPKLAGWIVYCQNPPMHKKIIFTFTFLSLIWTGYYFKGIYIALIIFMYVLSILSVKNIDWHKYEKDCRILYLTTRYLLSGNYGGLQALATEIKNHQVKKYRCLEKLYFRGAKGFLYKDILIFLRIEAAQWVMIGIIIIVCVVAGLYQNLFGIAVGVLFLSNFLYPFASNTIGVQKKGIIYPCKVAEQLIFSLAIPSVVVTFMFIPVLIAYWVGYNNMLIIALLPLIATVSVSSFYNAVTERFLNFPSLFLQASIIAIFYSVLANEILLVLSSLFIYFFAVVMTLKLSSLKLKTIYLERE